MFDPFGDFQSAGYLRNVEALKDPEMVKNQERVFFEAHLEEALDFLRSVKGNIGYAHFLRVHAILFGEFYPWAGRDRRDLGVGRIVGKGEFGTPGYVQFGIPDEIERAAEWGFRMGNDRSQMKRRLGTVMGAFAWAHPFLDGNGRAMLLVHAELCHRAGFFVDWPATDKQSYLAALTQELHEPERHLDLYLLPFIQPVVSADDLLTRLRTLPGLDGLGAPSGDNVAYREDDARALATYHQMKSSRGEDGGGGTVRKKKRPGSSKP